MQLFCGHVGFDGQYEGAFAQQLYIADGGDGFIIAIIGVLAAIGGRPRMLRAVFLRCGLLLGGAGTAIGLVAGVGLCWLLTVFEVLDFDDGMAEIYFIDRVPFAVRWTDLVAVVVFSLTVSALASRIPARRAARLRPADALRYE